ncbi:hypothetical protein XELAEV_18026014mg [Xenopus laevis]|uniref:Uncharacterized protein n=1 Tax=Xenopus laevis TaxID=8355 RepID=A0A974D331_XENLA|nr:hypothetical protein XELAEV_18026014mg [Xenopus laevis]
MAAGGAINPLETIGMCALEKLEDRVSRFNRYESMLGDMVLEEDVSDVAPTLFKNLEKQMSHELLVCWDILTLEKYISSKWIPRGLRIKKFPTFAKDDMDFANKWNNVLTKCSMELMGLIIEYKKHDLLNTREEINESQLLLMSLDKTPELERLDSQLKIYLQKLEVSVSARKRRKLKRDKRDYENNMVYLWHRPKSILTLRHKNKSGNHSQNKSVSFSSISSDSGGETSFCTEDMEMTSLCSTRRGPTEADLEDLEGTGPVPKTKENGKEGVGETVQSDRRKTRRGGRQRSHGKKIWSTPELDEEGQEPLNIVNISSVTLTKAQECVLSHGLSFAPTHHFNLFNTLLDVNRFVRKLTLRRHFGTSGLGTDRAEHSPKHGTSPKKGGLGGMFGSFREHCCLADLDSLQRESLDELQATGEHLDRVKLPKDKTLPSRFYPLQSRCTSMDTFQELVEKDLTKLNASISGRVPGNVSKEERQAINALRENTEITIRQADKERIREHIRSIENKDEGTPVGKHFALCSRKGTRDLSVKVIEQWGRCGLSTRQEQQTGSVSLERSPSCEVQLNSILSFYFDRLHWTPAIAPEHPAIAPLDPAIAPLDQPIAPLDQAIALMNQTRAPLGQAIAPLDQAIASLDPAIAPMDPAIDPLDQAIASLDQAIASLDQAIAPMNQAIALLDQAIITMNQAIAPMNQ